MDGNQLLRQCGQRTNLVISIRGFRNSWMEGLSPSFAATSPGVALCKTFRFVGLLKEMTNTPLLIFRCTASGDVGFRS